LRGMPDAQQVEVHIASADGSGDHLLVSLPAYAVFFWGASWSPDGKSIAVSTLQNGKNTTFVLKVIRVADGSVTALYSDPDFLGRPMWLPGGDSLLVPIGIAKENRTQIWDISYPKGERTRFTNDLSNYGPFLDLTRDGRMLAALDRTRVSNIWSFAGGKSAQGTQITSTAVPDESVAIGPNGKLLVRSRGYELDLINADGSQRTVVMPQARNYGAMASCGDRYIIFDSYNGATDELWRTDADGSNPTRLVDADIGEEDCSADGKWLIYDTNTPAGTKLYRMPLGGGAATEIANGPGGGGNPAISPDGKFIAYRLQEGSPVPENKFVVIPIEGGARLHTFPLPSGAGSPHWSPDGKALQFLLTRKGATNVWEFSLAGGDPHPVTDFTSGRIFAFAWSRDGKQLYVAKGNDTSDVVLISNFR